MEKYQTKNQKVIDWVNQVASITKPDAIYWCDGTEKENKKICDLLVKSGTFIPLNPKKRPNKMEFLKYDPVVRKHVLFKEEKLGGGKN